jgi:hypothetical protein
MPFTLHLLCFCIFAGGASIRVGYTFRLQSVVHARTCACAAFHV